MIAPRTLRLRRHLRLSQAAFALLVRQTQSTVVRLEAGQRETGPQSLILDRIEADIADGRLAAPATDEVHK